MLRSAQKSAKPSFIYKAGAVVQSKAAMLSTKQKRGYAKRRKFAYLHKVSGRASNFVPICNLSGGKAP